MKRIISISGLIFAFQLFLCSTVNANFAHAMSIYEEKRFDEAIVAFEALAAIGDRAALFNLGVMHYRGEGVQRNPERGYALMAIANKDYDDKQFSSVASKVYNSFNSEQQEHAASVMDELLPIYDIRMVTESIFPSPLDDEECEDQVLPILKVAPRYPRDEQMRGRMGVTITEYTVSPQGYARDVYIITSTSDLFSKASAKSALKFRYQPPTSRRPQYGIQNRFTYQIEYNSSKAKVTSKRLKKKLEKLKASADSGNAIAQYQYGMTLHNFRSFKEYLKGIDLQYRDANNWYEKSAKQGLPHAQYQIGRNMVEGQGCEVDTVNGMKWINAAAVSGYSPAQQFLARELRRNDSETEQTILSAMSWLRNAALSDYFPAKVQLAWELATSELEQLREPDESLELLEEEPVNYFDNVRILETRAAAHAMRGEFNTAIKLQRDAIDSAERLEWSIPVMHDRLGMYEHGEPWTGRYY